METGFSESSQKTNPGTTSETETFTCSLGEKYLDSSNGLASLPVDMCGGHAVEIAVTGCGKTTLGHRKSEW